MASKLEETIGSAVGEAACGASPAAEITAPKTQYVAYRLFIVNLFKNVPLEWFSARRSFRAENQARFKLPCWAQLTGHDDEPPWFAGGASEFWELEGVG
jgi:hypothetical protein